MPTPALTDLTSVREIRAAHPGPEAESVRSAYLELLKLCLCDLAGKGTMTVDSTDAGRLYFRELEGDELQLRASGRDWPLHGVTMVGLARLDDLQSCVESVVRDGVDGDLIEAGSWRGGASILIRAALDSLGADDRTLWVADSFQGFPLTDAAHVPRLGGEDDMHGLEFLSVPVEEVRGHFARLGVEQGVRFVPGFFDQTMPGLRGGRWSLVRLDGDTYEATWVTLEALYPGLSRGGHLIVDDYGAFEACRQAVDDFRAENGITEPLQEVDWTSVRWRRESEPASGGAEAPKPPRKLAEHTGAQGVTPRAGARIPHRRELELADEVVALRERLEAAEAELAELRRSWAARLGDRLRRARRGGGGE
jgi:hypothetical protein